MSKCRTCGTHIFEPGEPAERDAIAAAKQAVVDAAMGSYYHGGIENTLSDLYAACAALAKLTKE